MNLGEEVSRAGGLEAVIPIPHQGESVPVTPNSVRVEWLERACQLIRRDIVPGAPEKIVVTIGFPSRGATAASRRTIGECWGQWMKGEVYWISIHPILWPNTVKILETLVHEVLHPTVGTKHKHRAPFKKACNAVGLIGKATATVAGPALIAKLEAISAELGVIPPGEGTMEENGRKKSNTRLRKYVCNICGDIARKASLDWDAIHYDGGDCNGKYQLELGGNDEPTGNDPNGL